MRFRPVAGGTGVAKRGRRMRFPALLLSLAMIPACVDLDDDVPEGEDGLGDYDESTTDDKADTTEVRVRIDGLTVWVDPVARRTAAGYVIDGRASRNLAGVHSWVPDDAFATTAITGPRSFTVTYAPGHELNTMLAGTPIFVDLDPVTGEDATAAVFVKPRLTGFAGSSKLYVHKTVAPVLVYGELAYRGTVTASDGYGALASDNGDVTQLDATHFAIDWSYSAIATGVRVTATKGTATVTKTATLEVAVARLGLTRQDAREVWSSAPNAYRVAEDLRVHLEGWYADHGADVVGSGGNSLADAEAAIDPAQIEEVLVADEDPHAHALGAYRVFRHPDVAFPGSDNVWFVVYERSSNRLVEVYDFN